MKILLYQRDFTDLAVQPDVNLEVERYSRSVFGGPKRAKIQATGKAEELFELVNQLRVPIEIINNTGDCVWNGYVHSVSINTAIGTYNVSLDSMSNNIAVAYTDSDNLRHTTDWASDTGSEDEYGTKELLLSKADITDGDATQTRNVYLENSKYPIPSIRFRGGNTGTAILDCRGWYETLEWKYYENLTGKESYEDLGRGGREVGEDDRPIMAQSFQIKSTTAWDATSIWLRVWYQGSAAPPTDNLVVSLKSDNAGVPGTTLASSTLAPSAFSGYADWIEFELSTPVTLSPSTTYWIHVEKSNAITPTKYYMVDTNYDAGYERGTLFLYNTNTSSWGEDIHRDWGDMLFIVAGDTATTTQITTLVTNCGQFLQGTIIEDASGLDSNAYRDGDSSGLYEIERLLKSGTTNDRRLLCEVSRNRYLRVYEEDAEPDIGDSYAINKNGQLLTSVLAPVDPTLCTVGIWCHLQDVIPASVDFSLVSNPSLFFIDEAEYDVRTGEYNILATRNQEKLLDIGGVIQG
jgi:hypothetical protein